MARADLLIDIVRAGAQGNQILFDRGYQPQHQIEAGSNERASLP
jgi:hypothetical protein